MVIVAKNPVHAVLFLILTFFNAAGLFILLGAEFLAMLLVIVYVGAVAVLFLFVVMMLDVDFAELKAGFIKNAPVGLLVGGIVLAELVLLFLARGVARRPRQDAAARPCRTAISNTEALGQILYTKYVYFFQGAGLVLLVAMIGAIVLTLRHKEGVKRQSIARPGGARSEDGGRDGQGCVRAGGPAGGRQEACAGAGAGSRGLRRDGTARASSAGKKRKRRKREAGRRMEIGLEHYLTVAACLFTLGMFGIFLNRKNVIVILMSVELMLLAVNINFVAFSHFLGDLVGQVFALFVLTVAAAEAAIGLAIVVVYFRNRGSIAVEDINMMKG